MLKYVAPPSFTKTGSGKNYLSRGDRKLFQPEQLESRWVQAAMPYGATANDTGEFMLGRVAVTPVLLESTGQIDASTENWNQAHKDAVVAKIHEAFQWWEDLLATKTSVHSLDFVIDTTYIDNPSPTAYEPINRRSDDYALWSQEFLMRAGYDQFNSIEENMKAFNQAQRLKTDANWSFTIFVCNSEVEAEGTFATGGSFSRAFAFAGGLFFVIPSTRPSSTFAHETGHMFWARDEYAGSSSYYAQRGYYNTQNTNAIDNNPNPSFVQAPSIMAAADLLTNAYTQIVSPASTLAQLGWQDSDGDGIFDVLDVPLALDGVGRVDVTTGSYKFTGQATVQTLPNKNSSGLGNDITLNRISRIEAKINDGAWVTIASPDVYQTSLNLSIPIAGISSGTIQIRAVDEATDITSNVFEGQIGALPDATPVMGVNGFVFTDANANGLFDAVETGLAAQTVRLVDANGNPIILQRSIEPDAQVPGPIAANAYPNVTLSTFGSDSNGSLASVTDTSATTGTRVFRPYSLSRGGYAETWNVRRKLQVDFESPTSYFSIDVIGSGITSYGRLEAYDINDNLLARSTSVALQAGQVQKLEIGRDTPDIAYVVAFGHMETGVKLDNLKYGPKTQTITDTSGRYSFANLPAGQYRVQVLLPTVNSQVTTVGGTIQTLQLQSSALEHVDYGINFQNTAWHNPQIDADVNADGQVTAIDALLIVNLLNNGTPADLSQSGLPNKPYVDVSNDAFLTAIDALMVINAINGGAGEGEAVQSGSATSIVSANNGSGSHSIAEGEACLPWSADNVPTSLQALAGEGERASQPVMGPVPAAEDITAQQSTDECPLQDLAEDRQVIDSAPVQDDIIARLLANPWTTPQPCNCPECLATELTQLLTSQS